MNKYKILSIILAGAILCTGLFMSPVDAFAFRKQRTTNYLSEGYKPIIPNTHAYIRVSTTSIYGPIEGTFSQTNYQGYKGNNPETELPKHFFKSIGAEINGEDVIVRCQYIGDVNRQFESNYKKDTGYDGKGRYADYYLISIKRGELHDHSQPIEYIPFAYTGGKLMVVDRPGITFYLDDKPIDKDAHIEQLKRWDNIP